MLDYRVDDTVLFSCKVSKGVYFDHEMTFAYDITMNVDKALRTYGLIVRNCISFTNEKALVILYSAFTRTWLKYCSVIWFLFHNGLKVLEERLEKRFLKFLTSRIDSVYPEQEIPYTIR